MGCFVAEEATVVCVECLICQHRAIMGATMLAAVGAPSDVSLVELSRHLVCSICGSRAIRTFRTKLGDVTDFLAEHESG